MIAHVAEKGEERGRVVLQLGPSGRLSTVAVAAAIRVAKAFQSEIECLFVEDARLLDATSFPFAREISVTGRHDRSLTPDRLEREWHATALALQTEVTALARAADVPIQCRTVRDSIESALARACAETGPWNVIAIGEPLDAARAAGIGDVLAAIQGTTGIVLAGPNAQLMAGPVVALVEDIEHMPPMRRAAERIAAVTGHAAQLLILASGRDHAAWIEGQVRLALGGESDTGLSVVELLYAEPPVIAELLWRTNAGLTITQFGGLAVPSGQELAALAGVLAGPLLLVR